MKYACLLVVSLSLSACSKAPVEARSRSRLTPKQFVAVLVDLERSAPAQKDAILKKHHTTAAEVRDFVVKNAVDPVMLSAAFDSVQVRLDRIRPGAP